MGRTVFFYALAANSRSDIHTAMKLFALATFCALLAVAAAAPEPIANATETTFHVTFQIWDHRQLWDDACIQTTDTTTLHNLANGTESISTATKGEFETAQKFSSVETNGCKSGYTNFNALPGGGEIYWDYK